MIQKLLCKKGQAGEAVVVAGALILLGSFMHWQGLWGKNGSEAIHDIPHMRSFTNYNPTNTGPIFGGSSYKADWEAINLRYPEPTIEIAVDVE